MTSKKSKKQEVEKINPEQKEEQQEVEPETDSDSDEEDEGEDEEISEEAKRLIEMDDETYEKALAEMPRHEAIKIKKMRAAAQRRHNRHVKQSRHAARKLGEAKSAQTHADYINGGRPDVGTIEVPTEVECRFHRGEMLKAEEAWVPNRSLVTILSNIGSIPKGDARQKSLAVMAAMRPEFFLTDHCYPACCQSARTMIEAHMMALRSEISKGDKARQFPLGFTFADAYEHWYEWMLEQTSDYESAAKKVWDEITVKHNIDSSERNPETLALALFNEACQMKKRDGDHCLAELRKEISEKPRFRKSSFAQLLREIYPRVAKLTEQQQAVEAMVSLEQSKKAKEAKQTFLAETGDDLLSALGIAEFDEVEVEKDANHDVMEWLADAVSGAKNTNELTMTYRELGLFAVRPLLQVQSQVPEEGEGEVDDDGKPLTQFSTYLDGKGNAKKKIVVFTVPTFLVNENDEPRRFNGQIQYQPRLVTATARQGFLAYRARMDLLIKSYPDLIAQFQMDPERMAAKIEVFASLSRRDQEQEIKALGLRDDYNAWKQGKLVLGPLFVQPLERAVERYKAKQQAERDDEDEQPKRQRRSSRRGGWRHCLDTVDNGEADADTTASVIGQTVQIGTPMASKLNGRR